MVRSQRKEDEFMYRVYRKQWWANFMRTGKFTDGVLRSFKVWKKKGRK